MNIGEKKGTGPFDAIIVLIKEYYKAVMKLEFHSPAGHSNLLVDGLIAVCILLVAIVGGTSEGVQALCALACPEIYKYMADSSFLVLVGMLVGFIILCLSFMAVCEYVCRKSIPK